jgi:ankyrin repeat protein
MMRIGDKQRFEYLLNRGVYASCTDKDGNSAIHYCIKMEKIEFLSYLFEGEYHSYDHLNDENLLTDLTKL